MKLPQNYKYSKEHEWIKKEGENFIIGITDYAVEQLGDVIMVELPETGKNVKIGETIATVESVKTVSDVYCPISGTIKETNQNLKDNPEILNNSPFEEGWIATLKAADEKEFDKLMSASDYEKFLKENED